MAWKLLPVDYTDAVWSGLKKYNMVENTKRTRWTKPSIP